MRPMPRSGSSAWRWPGHRYRQRVESFRNEEGRPRQRTVAALGRLDETDGGADALLSGLLRVRHWRLLLPLQPASGSNRRSRSGWT